MSFSWPRFDSQTIDSPLVNFMCQANGLERFGLLNPAVLDLLQSQQELLTACPQYQLRPIRVQRVCVQDHQPPLITLQQLHAKSQAIQPTKTSETKPKPKAKAKPRLKPKLAPVNVTQPMQMS